MLKPTQLYPLIEIGSSELVVSHAAKIFADFGFKVTKIGNFQSHQIMDIRKNIIQQEFQLPKHQNYVSQSKAIIIHQDHIDLENTLSTILKVKKDIIVLVVHRINKKFKIKFHDAQLLAISSLLSHFGQNDNPNIKNNLPQPPPLLSSIVSSVGITIRVLQAIKENQTGIIRFSMLHNLMYLGNFHLNSYFIGMTSGARGTNILEGAAPFYRIYPTKDSFLCVGNIQTKFYEQMLKGLDLDAQTAQYLSENQMNTTQWAKMVRIFECIFKRKNTSQWIQIMDRLDTCVTEINELFPCSRIQPSPKLIRYNKVSPNETKKLNSRL